MTNDICGPKDLPYPPYRPHSPAPLPHVRIARNRELPIKAVFYMGDEGGISCDVTPPGMNDPLICSITQIRISRKHPLAEAIRAYQQERKKRLAQAGRGGPPTYFTVKPRKKRRR